MLQVITYIEKPTYLRSHDQYVRGKLHSTWIKGTWRRWLNLWTMLNVLHHWATIAWSYRHKWYLQIYCLKIGVISNSNTFINKCSKQYVFAIFLAIGVSIFILQPSIYSFVLQKPVSTKTKNMHKCITMHISSNISQTKNFGFHARLWASHFDYH